MCTILNQLCIKINNNGYIIINIYIRLIVPFSIINNGYII